MMACPTEMTVLESTEKAAIIMRTCVNVKCESLKGTQNEEDWPEIAENMPIYFHLLALYGCSIQVCTTEVCSLL